MDESVKSLGNEDEVHRLPDSPCKSAMENRIRIAHANVGASVTFDAMADCGGRFYLLEEGDDLKALVLGEAAKAVDLTDLDSRCYEYVELLADGEVFELFHATNDAGGDCFFVPNEPWLGESFRRNLAAAAARCRVVCAEEANGGKQEWSS